MKHGRTFAELALVAAAVLLIAACNQGPGEPPKPAWSPPDWMHGSWTGIGARPDETVVTATAEVSASNLKVSFQAGGVTFPLDLAQLTGQGAASVLADTGKSDDGKNYYTIVITPNAAGEPVHTFQCTEVDSTTMDCLWTQTTPPDEDVTTLGGVRFTKQPG